MITIKVERANSREFSGKSGTTFTSYSIASGGKWYQLAGKGKELVCEGDEITGITSTKEYLRKDGSPGISNIFELTDPVILGIITRLTSLEKRLSELDGKNSEKKPESSQPEITEIDNKFYTECKELAKKDRDNYDKTLYDFGGGKITSAKDIPESDRDHFLEIFEKQKKKNCRSDN